VAGVLGQRAHAAGSDVEQVLRVGRAERRTSCPVQGRVDKDDVERGAASAGRACQVQRGEAAGGAGTDHRDARCPSLLDHLRPSLQTA